MKALDIYEVTKQLNNQEKSLLFYMLKKDLLANKKQSFSNPSTITDEDIDLYLLHYCFNVDVKSYNNCTVNRL
jgi:hypothetical protein